MSPYLQSFLINFIEALCCIKVIKLKFVHEMDDIVLSVKNTYAKAPVRENEAYKTLKEENIEEHGIGLKNIIETIEKYSGSYVIQDENGVFFFSTVIPL